MPMTQPPQANGNAGYGQTDSANRTHGFKVPQPDPCADPSQWSDDELSQYGLPPRPDKASLPHLHELWYRNFGHELYFQTYYPVAITSGRAPDLIPDTIDSFPFISGGSRFVTSPNWSGSYLDAVSGRSFRQIWGQWVIPSLRLPPDSPTPDPATLPHQCAIWIGLDGQRLYADSTLPQVGTLQRLTFDQDGEPSMSSQAWTQWWVRNDSDTLPVGIKDFPLQAGNTISAVLTVLDDYNILCNLINHDTDPPTFVAVGVTSPPMTKPAATGDQAIPQYPIAGATAEWILERPAVIGKTTLHAFADFGETNFTHCYAAAADGADTPPVETTLLTPRYVRMFEVTNDPQHTEYISMPNRIDDTSFRLTYGDYWP